jgi:hypothetical protein
MQFCIYQTYVGKQQFAAVDLCALLRQTKITDDSPLNSQTADLQRQWEQRQHRLDDFLPSVPAVSLTGKTVDDMSTVLHPVCMFVNKTRMKRLVVKPLFLQ